MFNLLDVIYNETTGYNLQNVHVTRVFTRGSVVRWFVCLFVCDI